jgi:hypothetical protein
MARIDTGDLLTTALLQPGAKFQTDGFGLVTGVAVFKEDKAGSSAFLARGQPFPLAAFNFTKVHKANTSLDNLGISTYTVDYVGISAADGVSSTLTKTQITGSQGLTSESLTTHSNFFVLDTAGGFTGTPIAGVGTGILAAPVYATKTLSNAQTEYEGNNGSRFSEPSGNRFLGFKVALNSGYYGRTNYLAPQTSFSGHFYTTEATNVTGMRDRVGKTSGTNLFNGIKVVPDYVGTTFTNSGKNQLLLAQVSFEDYASLYKVTFEVRFNRQGYEPSVYAPA